MTKPYKKKLIEVAIPLEAINKASAREKSIRHGHPSTLHLWWARRPLAACRSVLFAQLVDDPSEYVDELLEDPKSRVEAERELNERLSLRERDKAEGKSIPAEEKPITLEDVAIDLERQRLFRIIEDLVKWENSTNEEVLERARAEIRRSCDGELPPVYDPFSGGCSIPLEAQRLGLPAYGSDLNPVAVMIGKAMIEIPPKFKDWEPIHPGGKDRNHYRNAEGLAEDIKYYGEWMREKAFERIGHLYPKVDLPKEYGGGKATVIAWIWSRTVPSPDPAFADVNVPIASSFLLSSKPGKEAWIEPIVDKAEKTITYRIRMGGTKAEIAEARSGTKAGHGASFRCLLSDTAITSEYVKEKSVSGELGQTLLAIVAVGNRQRIFLPPDPIHIAIATSEIPRWKPEIPLPNHSQYIGVLGYGFRTFGDLFTNRQLVALNTFSELIEDVRMQAQADASSSGALSTGDPLEKGGSGGIAYAETIALFLALALDRVIDRHSTVATWDSSPTKLQLRNTFSRQAIQMTWDFGEGNVFGDSSGAWSPSISWVSRVLEALQCNSLGEVTQENAMEQEIATSKVISTDPPYYDNIPYADLSDFFYEWLRKSLKKSFPALMSSLAVPKMEELVADRVRHGGTVSAGEFFLDGMTKTMQRLKQQSDSRYPTAVYYAFKQREIEQEGISSTGWATFLSAIINAGFSVVGTWPLRTELANRMRGIGANALANSVVLVCRKKEEAADIISRAEFIRALKRELPPAIAGLQAANISPTDMPQSAIGPGMGVFSRYKAVLESDDSPMTVKTALQLINRELDEYLGGIQGEFDADTRFTITWFEQFGMEKGDYGTANNIAQARGISVDSVKHAGIVESSAGNVRILQRDEMDPDWDPVSDTHLTVWECCQHLIRKLENDGEYEAAVLMKRIGSEKAEAAKDLAYCLYDISANKRQDAKEATSYNALIAVWTELTRQAATIHDTGGDRQAALDL